MKEYKVISVSCWWSYKNLAEKSENAINSYTKQGWKFLDLQFRAYGMTAMITFVKE